MISRTVHCSIVAIMLAVGVSTVWAGLQLPACADYVSGHAGTASLGLSWEISDTIAVAAVRIFANDSEEEDNWYFNISYALAWSQ